MNDRCGFLNKPYVRNDVECSHCGLFQLVEEKIYYIL